MEDGTLSLVLLVIYHMYVRDGPLFFEEGRGEAGRAGQFSGHEFFFLSFSHA